MIAGGQPFLQRIECAAMKRMDPGHAADPRSVLVVLPTWVGDFVMATPTLRAIRRRYADARITFLLEPNLTDLAAGGDWMDEHVEWPAKHRRRPWHREYRQLTADLRRRRLDLAILLSNSARSALVCYLGRVKRRIGYNRDGRGLLLTDRVAVPNRRNGKFVPLPIVEYYANLAEAIGCERPDDQLELFTTPACDRSVADRLADVGADDRHPLVVISPGASFGAAKCWLPERFAGVADRLVAASQATVIVTCGPGEEAIAGSVRTAMGERAVVFDDPRLTLGELKSLIKRSDLLICNDAGPRHFAKAFAVPVVTIFGPTHPTWTATSYRDERIARIEVECGPCQRRVCPLGHLKCMTGVTVDAVYNAAAELLDARMAAGSVAAHDG